MSNFNRLTQDALATNYGSNDLFGRQNLRLATLVQNRGIQFSDEMACYGHEYCFQELTDDSAAKTSTATNKRGNKSSTDTEGEHPCRTLPDNPALQEITEVQISDSVQNPRSGVHDWIEEEYKESRGFEIGVFNHTLLSTLMKKQTAKWPMLSLGYISDIVTMVHTFIENVLDAICVDKKIAQNILALLMDDLSGRYRDAIQQIEFLLRIERQGTPMTLNHYLNDNLEKWYAGLSH